MTTDPRVEAAAKAIYGPTIWDRDKKSQIWGVGRDIGEAHSQAVRVIGAIDEAASITSEFQLDKLEVGTAVISMRYIHPSGYPVVFQKLHDGEWHRGGRLAGTHPENFLPARVIHRGQA